MNFEEVYKLYKTDKQKFDEWYNLDETIEIPLKLNHYSIYLMCEALADDQYKSFKEDPSEFIDDVLYESSNYFL